MVPRVVPAECIVYLTPDFLSTRWTSATSFETEAVGVPIGMRQKSCYSSSQYTSLRVPASRYVEDEYRGHSPARHADGVGSF